MTANKNLLRMKYVRVIEAFASRTGCSLEDALDAFYRSQTYELMRDGISDMHCMSIDYLVEELLEERTGHPAHSLSERHPEIKDPPLCVAESGPSPYKA